VVTASIAVKAQMTVVDYTSTSTSSFAIRSIPNCSSGTFSGGIAWSNALKKLYLTVSCIRSARYEPFIAEFQEIAPNNFSLRSLFRPPAAIVNASLNSYNSVFYKDGTMMLEMSSEFHLFKFNGTDFVHFRRLADRNGFAYGIGSSVDISPNGAFVASGISGYNINGSYSTEGGLFAFDATYPTPTLQDSFAPLDQNLPTFTPFALWKLSWNRRLLCFQSSYHCWISRSRYRRMGPQHVLLSMVSNPNFHRSRLLLWVQLSVLAVASICLRLQLRLL